MVDSWLRAVNVAKLKGCVLVDFRKAFDLVDHTILLKKLQCYRCHETCLKWFESYLTNRTQRVSLNSHLSESAHVSCGLPKGSILGPLLFLIFINDLPQIVRLLLIRMQMIPLSMTFKMTLTNLKLIFS